MPLSLTTFDEEYSYIKGARPAPPAFEVHLTTEKAITADSLAPSSQTNKG